MPKWRPFTWVILVINVLFLIWVIAGISGGASEVRDCEPLALEAEDLCEAENAGTALGTGIGIAVILFFWVAVDVILGLIWLVTRPKRRPCPSCGTDVKPGVTVCPKCGFDFAAAARGGPPPAPPPPPVQTA